MAGLVVPGPRSRGWFAETSGRVVLRFSRLQVPSLGALTKEETWRLGIKNATLQAGGFRCGVFRRGPVEWDPSGNENGMGSRRGRPLD